jgi:peptide chain release factor 1
VDELLDDDRLAHAGPTEDADLAALLERADQVDDLEAGLEDLDLGRLLVERGRVKLPALLARRSELARLEERLRARESSLEEIFVDLVKEPE